MLSGGWTSVGRTLHMHVTHQYSGRCCHQSCPPPFEQLVWDSPGAGYNTLNDGSCISNHDGAIHTPVHAHDKSWSAVATLAAIVLGYLLLDCMESIRGTEPTKQKLGYQLWYLMAHLPMPSTVVISHPSIE